MPAREVRKAAAPVKDVAVALFPFPSPKESAMPVKTKPKTTRKKRLQIAPSGYMPPLLTMTITDSAGHTMSPFNPQITISGTLSAASAGTIYGVIIDANTGSLAVPSQSMASTSPWQFNFDLTGVQKAGTVYSYYCKVSFEATDHDDIANGSYITVQF